MSELSIIRMMVVIDKKYSFHPTNLITFYFTSYHFFVISYLINNIDMLNELPSDPFMLLSFINTKLRDNYSTLDELCDDLDVSKQELNARLLTIGYVYNPSLNKFV